MLRSKLCLVAAATLLLSACATTTPPESLLTPREEAQLAQMSVEQLNQQAQALVKKAQEAQLDFYAPPTMQTLTKEAEKIGDLLNKKEADKVGAYVLLKQAQQTLETGLRKKSIAQIELKDVLDNKVVLDDLAAEQVYAEDYQDIISDIKDLASELDKENADKVSKKKPDVIASMKKLEVKIVNDNNLNVVKTIIESARAADAEDFSPKSFKEATQAYEKANQFIATNPRDTKEIKRLSNTAMFFAKRTVWMTAEVTRLRNMKADDFENLVIEEEQRLHHIGSALRYDDVRDRKLQEQSDILAFIAGKTTDHARTCPVASDAQTQGLETGK